MSNNVGFYPTTMLNPETTTIGSQGNYQSIMSYIYGANTYEMLGTYGSQNGSGSLIYTGINLSFTPTNSQDALLYYNIVAQLLTGGGTESIVINLCIDTNPPPAVESAIPSTATVIDSGGIALNVYRSQILQFSGGYIYGGANSGTAYTLNLNTTYYFTWYLMSGVTGSEGALTVLGMSVQSI